MIKKKEITCWSYIFKIPFKDYRRKLSSEIFQNILKAKKNKKHFKNQRKFLIY